MTPTLLLHLGDGELRHVKEASNVGAQESLVVSLGVLGERLGNEDASVVDERVDTPESGHAFRNSTLGGFSLSDVTGDCQNFIIVRRLDRARGRDHPIVALAVRLDESCSNALRRAGNNSDFLFSAHSKTPLCF